MVDESETFVDFCTKGGVRKLPESFFLVEVGPSNNDCAAFVSRFGNCYCVFFRLFSADQSAEEGWEIWCYD